MRAYAVSIGGMPCCSACCCCCVAPRIERRWCLSRCRLCSPRGVCCTRAHRCHPATHKLAPDFGEQPRLTPRGLPRPTALSVQGSRWRVEGRQFRYSCRSCVGPPGGLTVARPALAARCLPAQQQHMQMHTRSSSPRPQLEARAPSPLATWHSAGRRRVRGPYSARPPDNGTLGRCQSKRYRSKALSCFCYVC